MSFPPLTHTEQKENAIMEEKRIPAALQKAMAVGYEQIPQGEVASYIPELAKARKDAPGICTMLSNCPIYVNERK